MAAESKHALGAKTLAWVSTALLVAIFVSIAVVDRPLALLIENQLGGATRMAGGITTALEWIFAFDLSTFALVTFALALVALFASYIPALRATKADPMIALGHGG